VKLIRKFKNYSIRQAILVSTVLIISIAMSIVTIGNYINFNSTTTDLVENTSKELNKQIILNYESYISSVVETANYIAAITTEYGLDDNTEELNSVYEQATDLQTDITSIFLLDIYGNRVVGSDTDSIAVGLRHKSWFKDALINESIFHFSSPHIQDVFESSDKEVITITTTVDYYDNLTKKTGVLVVDLLIDNIVELSTATNLGENGHLIILNDDDTLIYSSTEKCIDNSCPSVTLVEQLIIGGDHVNIDGTSMYLSVNTLKNTRWRIATFVNTELLAETRSNTILFSAIIIAVTLFITIIVSSTISKRISTPLQKLMNHMQKIQKGNLYKRIELEGQIEVVVLADRFNIMIDEIRDLMETVLREQKDKRKTEFIALQTQINPHFLYNTLDSIIYLSEHKQNEKVIQMVSALSKFFRISISRGKNIILLKEELEHARNYLLIQQIRYNEKFKFEFQVDENTHQYKVVKLLLQPLIENAIYHGINTEYNEGIIIIRSYVSNEKLYLEVEDDGYGITEEGINELYDQIKIEKKSKSVGLRNVYQRLKLYYGEDSDFIIESELDTKTIFRLEIPIERA
jgi:two-component system sensor histidine kinase YesM